MDLVIFENNKPFVSEALRKGDFDYMEAASEVFEADFFPFIKARSFLDERSQSYPTPRKKQAGRKVVHPEPGDTTIRYEGSVKLLFDEHNHPVSQEQYRKMSDDQKIRCQWRRCYKMVTLLHTTSSLEFFL